MKCLNKNNTPSNDSTNGSQVNCLGNKHTTVVIGELKKKYHNVPPRETFALKCCFLRDSENSQN